MKTQKSSKFYIKIYLCIDNLTTVKGNLIHIIRTLAYTHIIHTHTPNIHAKVAVFDEIRKIYIYLYNNNNINNNIDLYIYICIISLARTQQSTIERINNEARFTRYGNSNEGLGLAELSQVTSAQYFFVIKTMFSTYLSKYSTYSFTQLLIYANIFLRNYTNPPFIFAARSLKLLHK